MSKRLTIKELEERINVLAYNLNVTKYAIDRLSMAFEQYVIFRGKQDEFKKHLEINKNVDKLTEDVKNDTK